MPPSEVGAAYIAIKASTAGFAQEARSQINSELRGARESATVPIRTEVTNRAAQESGLKRDVGGMVKSVAAYAGGIFAAAQVFNFAKDVVNEAAAVQKAEESIRAEYGKTAEAAITFAHGQATSFGISAAASETASARIGALLQNMGFAPAKAQAMNLGLQKVVGAMSEMRNIDPATVLARLNTTLATGSTRGLRDLGVALDSASIKAEALKLHLPGIVGPSAAVATATLKVQAAQDAYNKVLETNSKTSLTARTAANSLHNAHLALAAATTHVSGTLTVAEKDQAIYGLVTAHSSQLMQEAKKHSGDLAVQQKILSAEWANAKASLGEALLPVITSLFRELVAGVHIIKEYRTEFIAAAAVIGTASLGWAAYTAAVKAKTFVEEAGLAVSRAITVFQGAQAQALRAATVGQEAYTAAMAANKTEQEAQAAATKASTIETDALNASMLANPAVLIIGSIALLAGGLYELYQHSATARRIMNELWKDIRSLGVSALHALGPALSDVAGAIGTVASAVGTGIGDAVGIITSGVHLVERIWRSFWSGPFGNEVRFAVRLVTADVHDVVSIVTNVVNLVGNIIHGRWGAAWHNLVSIVGTGIGLALRLLLQGPALFLHGAILLGEAIWHGIRGEVTKLPGQVWGFIRQVPGAIIRGDTIVANAAIRLGGALLHGAINEAQKLPDQIWHIIRGLPAAELRGLKIIGDAALSLGKRLVSGIIHGVGNLGSDLKNAVESHVKDALSSLNPFSPVEHGGELYIAQPIMKGTISGLDPFQHNLTQAIGPPLVTVMKAVQQIGVQQGHFLGLDISRNTIAGLSNLQTGLGNAIVAAANSALAHAKAALGISSPSSVFAREIGQPLAQGIIHGMGGLEKALADKVTKAAKAAQAAAGGFGAGITPQGTAAVGANQALGRQMMLAAGWGADQWGALQALWTRESGWNANAVNPSSGAYGIPQSLGHGHPYNLGDARAQIAWGLEYIRGRYGSPGAAWLHEEKVGWYHQGGVVPGSSTQNVPIMAQGGEFVLKPDQFRALAGRSVSIGQVVIVEPRNGREAGDELLNEIAQRIGSV